MFHYLQLVCLFAAGYLVSVLWIDLKFDTIALPYHKKSQIPEEKLVIMANFFGGITSKPILIAIVMISSFFAIIAQMYYGFVPAWLGIMSLVFFVIPTGYAAGNIIPSARRLGARKVPIEEQNKIADSLFFKHGFCLIFMVLFLITQVYALFLFN